MLAAVRFAGVMLRTFGRRRLRHAARLGAVRRDGQSNHQHHHDDFSHANHFHILRPDWYVVNLEN